jgi:hypothetical protein
MHESGSPRTLPWPMAKKASPLRKQSKLFS